MLQALTPLSTTINYLIGAEPKYGVYNSAQIRIESFDKEAWRQHPIFMSSSPHLTPESFASAGFFYTGTADNVTCFWCGLGLNHWEVTDEPLAEHARFTPRCTWLLRTLGCQKQKRLYMNTIGSRSDASTVPNIKLADYAFICDVQDVAGKFNICQLLLSGRAINEIVAFL